MTVEHLFFAVVTLWLGGLTWKLWVYRAAIIKLQEDMTLVLNDLTRPADKQTIYCTHCERTMNTDQYAQHRCLRDVRHAHAV